jgi:phenylacetic acid degradation protein
MTSSRRRIYAIDGVRPVVDPTAFVHPDAVLIGDVTVGPGCYVAPGASLRGDFARIILEEGCNVQDNCTLHSLPGVDLIIGPDGHIGHGAIIHSAQIGSNAMVGMNSVIMDHAIIGESAIVAAMTFVATGVEIPARHLAMGIPARVVRELTVAELAAKIEATGQYHQLTYRSLKTHAAVDPLTEIELDRRPVAEGVSMPLRDIVRGRRGKTR